MLFRCDKSLHTLLFTFCEAESVNRLHNCLKAGILKPLADSLVIASGEVALTHHFKVAKMRTLDTRRQLTVLQLLLITSNPLLLCPGQIF